MNKAREIIKIEKDVIVSICNKPITMIAVDINGQIKNYVSLEKKPSSADELIRLVRLSENKNCSVSFISQKNNFSLSDLHAEIEKSIKALQYSKTHKLKPGVNIPGNTKYYSLKQKLANKLKKKF